MLGPDFLTNPYPTYAYLRSAAPVLWSDDFIDGAWLLTRYEDVSNALRDPRFSAKRSHIYVGQFPEEFHGELAEFDHHLEKQVIFLDPPEHSRLRRLMNHGFTMPIIQSLRPRIEKKVKALLDKVIDQGEMDFMRDFAHPLPVIVIAEMFGVEEEDQSDFIAWSDDCSNFIGSPQPTLELARRAQASMGSLVSYFASVLPERRKQMGDDLISRLLHAEEEGVIMTDEELLAQCSLFFIAGHETTRNLLGNGLLALLQHPEQLALLKENPQLMKSALGELLRYESPIQFTGRIATEDIQLGGQEIKQGQPVFLLIGAANRDPERFTDPDELDITRKEGSNLAFGYGPHVCIGATLSYLEAETAFTILLDRLPDLRLVSETVDWNPNPGFRGLRSLPLAFSRIPRP